MPHERIRSGKIRRAWRCGRQSLQSVGNTSQKITVGGHVEFSGF